MSIRHFTDENFEQEVLRCDLPVIVDFWAGWCGPCKMIAPLVEETAAEYEGKVKIGKLNVDECPESATTYGVMSIPTLMFFKDGKVVDQAVGVISKAQLRKKIDANI